MSDHTLCQSRRDFLRTGGACLATTVVLAVVSPVEATETEARYPIPATDGVSMDEARQVIIARQGTRVFAFARSCPHERSALRWRPRDGRFQCPKHESKYTPDGTFTSGRATRNMDRYPVSLAGGMLVVDLSRTIRSDAARGAWDAAVVTVP